MRMGVDQTRNHGRLAKVVRCGLRVAGLQGVFFAQRQHPAALAINHHGLYLRLVRVTGDNLPGADQLQLRSGQR